MSAKTRVLQQQSTLVAGLILVACFASPTPAAAQEKKSDKKKGVQSDEFDSVVVRSSSGYRLVNGSFKRGEEIYKGRVLEVTPKNLYFESWRGKKSVSRKSILEVRRHVEQSRVNTFEKYRKAAKKQAQWDKLLAFCEKHGLAPEARACKRALLKFSPDNETFHLAIGEKKHAGKWIDEFRVESMLQSGYEIKGNELVKSDGDENKKKRKKRHSRKIKALDHVKEAVEKKNPHSLWMLLARSAVPFVPGSKKGLNLAACEKFVDWLDQNDDFGFRMRSFLAEYEVPRDWNAVNAAKAKRFLEKHEDSIHHETKYYHVLSTMSPAATKEFGLKMDLVTKGVYQKIFEFDEKIPFKYVVRIYDSEKEYWASGGMRGAGAHYEPGTKDLVGYPRRRGDGWDMDTFSSMFHEGWHQYFDYYIPNAPRWFDEGFAEIASPVQFVRGRAKMRPFNPPRSHALKLYQRAGKLLALHKMIRMDRREFYSPGNVGPAYAQAWSFVYFLTNFKHKNPQTQKKVRGFYKDYFWELHKGTDPVEACDVVFKDVKFSSLERLWRDSIRDQK